jgi:isoamylase
MQPTPGKPYPSGATLSDRGVNFSIFSRNALGMELLFFDNVDDRQPSHTIGFNQVINRTYHYWHMFVPGVRSGQIYGFRAGGPFDPSNGMRFDSSKVLLDPYGRGVVIPAQYTRDAAHRPGDIAGTAMKSVVIDCSEYQRRG